MMYSSWAVLCSLPAANQTLVYTGQVLLYMRGFDQEMRLLTFLLVPSFPLGFACNSSQSLQQQTLKHTAAQPVKRAHLWGQTSLVWLQVNT